MVNNTNNSKFSGSNPNFQVPSTILSALNRKNKPAGPATKPMLVTGPLNGKRPLGPGEGPRLPEFKKGGKVKKTGPIMAHKGEYVLPASVKPTKKQVSKVSKLRKRK